MKTPTPITTIVSSIVTGGCIIAVALGFIGPEDQQIIVSAAGGIAAGIVAIAGVVAHRTAVQARVALHLGGVIEPARQRQIVAGR